MDPVAALVGKSKLSVFLIFIAALCITLYRPAYRYIPLHLRPNPTHPGYVPIT